MIPIIRIPADQAAPNFKRFRSALGNHLLVVPHSRIFDLADDFAEYENSPLLNELVDELAETLPGEVSLDQVIEPSPQSISLNVSASCNLSCSYCYAARGSFEGAQPNAMDWEVARRAIDKLLSEATPEAPITVGFLGGEPFVNRSLIHQSVKYAAAQGARRGLDVRFSVTTNGTLLKDEDLNLIRSHRFAVTVSVDGGERIQNLQRPLPVSREGSYDLLKSSIGPLLHDPGSTSIAARATVTRFDLNLPDRFAQILSLGFPEVGFAPLRAAEAAAGVLNDEDWPRYLGALIDTARPELERAERGQPMRHTNLAVGLKQLYRGASSPYPCGAGGGYFSVAANGDWYACHRAIGSPEYRLGDNDELDSALRRKFLIARHVHSQAACNQCWARYLCSGGCHQEASHRSDSSCGFIRGWLEFCLTSYCELLQRRPEFFNPTPIA